MKLSMNANLRAVSFQFLAIIAGFVGASTSLAQSEQGDADDYTFRATYQIQKGTRTGRILIHVDMPETWHTYSLSQPSPPGSTEIDVKKSEQFKVTGELSADREPKITDDDPIFGRLEEHYDEVTFVVPIEVAESAKLEKLQIGVTLTCQICSESTCEFIKKRALEVEFDGYFEPKPPEKKQSPTPGSHNRDSVSSGRPGSH